MKIRQNNASRERHYGDRQAFADWRKEANFYIRDKDPERTAVVSLEWAIWLCREKLNLHNTAKHLEMELKVYLDESDATKVIYDGRGNAINIEEKPEERFVKLFGLANTLHKVIAILQTQGLNRTALAFENHTVRGLGTELDEIKAKNKKQKLALERQERKKMVEEVEKSLTEKKIIVGGD